MTMNLYAVAICTPRALSVANINGLIYKEVSGSDGTQSSSTFTNAFTASTNISSGTSGMQSLALELIILFAFISGRNN